MGDDTYFGLRERVLRGNQALAEHGLTVHSWGNVSEVDRDVGAVAIKPSGVPFAMLEAEDIVVVDLAGEVLWGARRPSTDTPTHLCLYRACAEIGGIAHAHSLAATAWAQAARELPVLGTTHADFCAEAIPLTDPLAAGDIDGGYESATGEAILAALAGRPGTAVPAVLVHGHAPFAWGGDAIGAVHAAVTLETIAGLAALTLQLNPLTPPLSGALVAKHFERKHGSGAYYGQ